ncbi:MAG: hypothetical protein JWQ13_1951 [Ramlibacter sp.]|jgi:uncharacterized membrane protein YhaH (DUF805 family)|nr:hypothetical protein [Ramlibacter sp.]
MDEIQKAVKTCLTKYADFNGRAARPEFWWFVLALVVVSTILNAVVAVLGMLFSLATLVPSLSAGARRLHDTGKTGWLQLLWIIPVLGWAVLIYLLAQPGEAGANKYGPPPEEQPGTAAVVPGQ